MKTISLVLLFLLFTPLSWGSESLFSFFRNHKLGSKVTALDEGFSELPDVEIYGQKFSVYQELASDKAIRKVGLYLRSNSTDASRVNLQGLFNRIRESIFLQIGEAEPIDLPNFQDATERTGSLYSWKNSGSILILEIVQSPSRTELNIQHSEIDYFTSNLGADTGAYLLPKLEANSGQLSIPASAPSPPDSDTVDTPPRKARETDIEAIRRPDLADGAEPSQPESILQNEESETATWPLVIAVIVVLCLVVILVQAFVRGRAS